MSGVDLSPGAIAERQHAKAMTGQDGGFTGRQLIDVAAANFRQANRLRKVATGRTRPARRERADRKADEALQTAAAQIRLAQFTPLDRAYLHALTIERIQTVKAEVVAAFAHDPLALALDTNRRIADQRHRTRAEGATPR